MRSSLLHALLSGPAAPPSLSDPAEAARLGAAPHPEPTDAPAPLAAACMASLRADRLGVAFAAGYAAGLHALVPALRPGALASLCVTEETGNSPGAIRCELREGKLWGDKRFATLGPIAETLLVLVRVGEREDGRPRLRVASIDPQGEGVFVERLPATRFVPEVPHAKLHFEGAPCPEERLLPGDGWDDVVRPFRTVEDLYVAACALSFAIGVSRVAGLPSITEACAALLACATSLARRPVTDPSLHVAVAGLLPLSRAQLERLATEWIVDEPIKDRLLRDLPLLAVAEPARRARTERARTLLALDGAAPVDPAIR